MCQYGGGDSLRVRFVGTDGSGNIVTAIDSVDNDKVGGMVAVDVDKGIAIHISHSCTAIHFVQIAGTHGDGGVA